MKPIKAWACFSDGRIHVERVSDTYTDIGERGAAELRIYASRKDAEKRYRDVRQVEIREVVAPKKKPRRGKRGAP